MINFMCGIGGFVSFQSKNNPEIKNILEKMKKSLLHRGPDYQDLTTFLFGGFAHTRLSIIDLDFRSNQPMWNKDKSYCIVFNGEIYNYQILKKQLEEKGYHFFTSSDTEVIIVGFQEFGTDFFKMLNGIFSIAIWDSKNSELTLARDPVGVKPLYYSFSNQQLTFGSEVKAILCNPMVDRDIDTNQIDHFFTFGYTDNTQTGIQSVSQISPGHYLKFNKNQFEIKKYWTWNFNQKHKTTIEEETHDFEKMLIQSVKSQTLSDVPITSFLSGGLDSTSIAWALRKINRVDVKLFTFAFQQSHYDESEVAKETAEYLDFEQIIAESHDEFRDLPEKISYFLDGPMADSSSLAMYLLCKEASKQFKVALSGDGADELLAGYSTYRATYLSGKLKNYRISSLFGILSPLTNLLPKSEKPYSAYQKTSRFFSYSDKPFPYNHASWRTHFTEKLKLKIYNQDFLNSINSIEEPYKNYAKVLKDIPYSNPTQLQEALFMDLTYYMPNDMLIKVDRMSMANGLEVRVPFLDIDMINYCMSLPDHMKVGELHSESKLILKKTLAGKIPKTTLRKKKQGFVVPINSYLNKFWLEQIHDLLESHKCIVGRYINIQNLKKQMEAFKNSENDISYELFDILIFLFWLNNLKI